MPKLAAPWMMTISLLTDEAENEPATSEAETSVRSNSESSLLVIWVPKGMRIWIVPAELVLVATTLLRDVS